MFAWFFVSFDVLSANASSQIALLRVSGVGESLCPLQVMLIPSNLSDSKRRVF